MISRPFCALLLGLCLALMPFTAWVALMNARLGQTAWAWACLLVVVAQALIAALEVFLLSR